MLGLSGGVDSLALLDLLCRHAAERELAVHACHIHHGMRGAEADADAVWLAEFCVRRTVPFRVERADVPGLAAEWGCGLEEAGRRARYRALAAAAREWGCSLVLTAHHADDQAETVLLHLFRGCALPGLAGMPRSRLLSEQGEPALRLLRPLLRIPRAHLEAYCRTRGLAPLHDATNDDCSFRRNQIRHRLLPLLEEYDPAVRRHLARLADQAREAEELLGEMAAAKLQELAPDGGDLRLDALAGLHPALADRLLILWMRSRMPELELSSALLDRVRQVMQPQGPCAVSLPGGWFCLRRRRTSLWMEEVEETPGEIPEAAGLAPGEEVEWVSHGIRISLAETEQPSQARMPPSSCLLPVDEVRGGLRVRAWSPGDRMRPFGAPGRRKISDLLGEAGTPRRMRRGWPVVEDEEGILWLCGIAASERCRLPEDAGRCLLIRVTEPGMLYWASSA